MVLRVSYDQESFGRRLHHGQAMRVAELTVACTFAPEWLSHWVKEMRMVHCDTMVVAVAHLG